MQKDKVLILAFLRASFLTVLFNLMIVDSLRPGK